MYADALLGILTLGAFVFVFYGPWQSLCTDWARQTIFESRDGIFDLARDGQLDFSSSEYSALRSSLNCLIRFAHEVTWVEFLTLYSALRKTGQIDQGSDLKQAIGSIANEKTDTKSRDLWQMPERAVVFDDGIQVPASLRVARSDTGIRHHPEED